MIKTTLTASVASFAVAGLAAAAQVNIFNGGFENPAQDLFVDLNSTDADATTKVPGFVATFNLSGSDYAFYGNQFGGLPRGQQETPDPTDNDGFLYVGNSELQTAAANRFAVQPGDVLDLSFDARTEQAVANPTDIPLVAGFQFFDSAGDSTGFALGDFLAGSDGTGLIGVSLDDVVVPSGSTSGGLVIRATIPGVTVNVDNFQADLTPIPEPASIAAVGLLGALGLRRRR
ncbi:MAG: PEP-CTERM sorting domain-containing protein [Planctomycetota bacterium]